MDVAIGFLTFGTLGFVAVFGFLSAGAWKKCATSRHQRAVRIAERRARAH